MTLPAPLAERTNCALAVVGASWPVVSFTVYFCHAAVTAGESALATVTLPSSSTSDAVTGPAKPPPPLA